MPHKTKSHLIAESATMRARLAELEDRLANLPAGRGEEPQESEIHDELGQALTALKY